MTVYRDPDPETRRTLTGISVSRAMNGAWILETTEDRERDGSAVCADHIDQLDWEDHHYA